VLEFLIVSGRWRQPALSIDSIPRLGPSERTCWVDGRAVAIIDRYDTGVPDLIDSNAQTATTGFVVNGDRLVQLPNGDSRGAFASLSLSNGSATATTDPLGAVPLFVGEFRSHAIVGTNIRMVRDAAAALGHRVEIDGSQLAWNIVLANQGSFATMFRGIRMVLPGQQVHLRRGRARFVGQSFLDILYQAADVDTLADQAAEDIAGSIAAVAGGSWRLQADLTGGLDSRTVLGGLLHAGILDQTELVTYGADSQRADAVVARDLCHRFGFKLGEKGGATGSEPSDEDRVRSFIGGIESNVRLTAGHVQGFTPLRIRNGDPGRLTFWGLFGENARSFYGRSVDKMPGEQRTPEGIANRILVNLGLLTGPARRDTVGQVEEFLDAKITDGLSPIDAADALFVERRARWFHGLSLTGQWHSEPSYAPLGSVAAATLAFAVGERARIREYVPFMLLERFDRRLLEVPFAKHVWHPALYEDRHDLAHLATLEAVTGIGRPLQYQYAHFHLFRPVIAEELAGDSLLWDVFDRDAVHAWLADEHPTPHQMMGLINLYGVSRTVAAI
jgi:hypothetical protein